MNKKAITSTRILQKAQECTQRVDQAAPQDNLKTSLKTSLTLFLLSFLPKSQLCKRARKATFIVSFLMATYREFLKRAENINTQWQFREYEEPCYIISIVSTTLVHERLCPV